MRTLPLRLTPIDSESLPGYVARYSHTFQFPPGDALRALGLDGGSGAALAAGPYGAWLSPRRTEQVAIATGIEPATIERMLLSRYAGAAFAKPTGPPDAAPAAAARGRAILIRRSRFCPHCLREDGAWLLNWQLVCSCVCVAHRALLLRRCPSCDAAPVATLRERWPSDHNGALSDPTRCPHRSRNGLCRAPLARAGTAPASDVAVAAQHRVNRLLDHGGPLPALAGVQLDAPSYLCDLLKLSNLVHRYTRTDAQQRRRAQSGYRVRDHPADLAAALPNALALADLPDPDTLGEALRQRADDRFHNDGLTLVFINTGPMSEPLKAALRAAISRAIWTSASRQLELHPGVHHRPNDLDPRLQLQHVPRLFWAADYHHEIADLLDGDLAPWHGRRLCSMLLARMLSPLDWDAAAHYLDLPDPFTDTGYNTAFAKLRTNSQFTELARRVKQIANQHAKDGLIDYRQGRASPQTSNAPRSTAERRQLPPSARPGVQHQSASYGTRMNELDALLAEQVAYYRALAPEYLQNAVIEGVTEEAQNATMDAILAALDTAAPLGDVLELACGPGSFTSELALRATSVTALDASPEMLELAAARTAPSTNIHFAQADLFQWTPDRRYPFIFFGFWLSHVPPQRFAGFWSTVASALAPDGQVTFVDDGYRTSDELIEGPESSTIERRLLDGRRFRAIKAPLQPASLEASLRELGWGIEIQTLAEPFFLGAAAEPVSTQRPRGSDTCHKHNFAERQQFCRRVGARFDDSGLRGEMAAGARSVAALGQRVWSRARASERAADGGSRGRRRRC